MPPKFLENSHFALWRFFKQNGVIRLQSNILANPNFWAGYATASNTESSLLSCFFPAEPLVRFATAEESIVTSRCSRFATHCSRSAANIAFSFVSDHCFDHLVRLFGARLA